MDELKNLECNSCGERWSQSFAHPIGCPRCYTTIFILEEPAHSSLVDRVIKPEPSRLEIAAMMMTEHASLDIEHHQEYARRAISLADALIKAHNEQKEI